MYILARCVYPLYIPSISRVKNTYRVGSEICIKIYLYLSTREHPSFAPMRACTLFFCLVPTSAVLQCVAVCCSVLQCSKREMSTVVCCVGPCSQCVAVSVLQSVCCSQCAAVDVLQSVCCIQCVAVSVLQSVCCSQCVAVSVLQSVSCSQ